MNYKKPDAAGVNTMLEMIAGPDAQARPLESFDEGVRSHQALFIDDDDKVVALCCCDLPAAVGLGCSLSMIPQAGMQGMLDDKALSDSANSNLYEVMNILSSLFMDDRSHHLKLDRVISSDFQSIDAAEIETACFTLNLGKYGTGLIRFQSM